LFFKILLYKLIGYIRINVEGFYIEKFINICRQNGIFLWGIKREKASIMHTNISIKDFKKIKRITKQINCRVHIERKKGLPFFLDRYKKRKIFVIGLIAILLIIFGTSNFVWNIEVVGNEKINKDELIQELKEQGLEIGTPKRKINKNEIINTIRLKRNDVSWVGINIKGTNVTVKIVETEEKPEIINQDEYCNIVANKDALIQKIDSTKGTSVVKEGDLVKKGSILIGGWMEGKYTGVRYVHGAGKVMGKVWYTETARVQLKEEKIEKTGKEEKKYRINFNNFQINLYKTLSKFEKYDTIYTDKKVKIFSDFYLPVSFTECNNFETISKTEEYTQEEAKNIAIERAEKKLAEQVTNSDDIQDKKINVITTNDYVEVEVIYEVLENIGTEEKIVF
jgi:similar to stage IV sporulation protein